MEKTTRERIFSQEISTHFSLNFVRLHTYTHVVPTQKFPTHNNTYSRLMLLHPFTSLWKSFFKDIVGLKTEIRASPCCLHNHWTVVVVWISIFTSRPFVFVRFFIWDFKRNLASWKTRKKIRAWVSGRDFNVEWQCYPFCKRFILFFCMLALMLPSTGPKLWWTLLKLRLESLFWLLMKKGWKGFFMRHRTFRFAFLLVHRDDLRKCRIFRG